MKQHGMSLIELILVLIVIALVWWMPSGTKDALSTDIKNVATTATKATVEASKAAAEAGQEKAADAGKAAVNAGKEKASDVGKAVIDSSKRTFQDVEDTMIKAARDEQPPVEVVDSVRIRTIVAEH